MNDYSDIINLEHPEPKNHVRMSIQNRAGQFSPFSALSGYSEELEEARRIVDIFEELNEDKKEILDKTLKNINTNEKVKITYFIKDLKKDGGFYKTIITRIIKIDTYNKSIKTEDGIIYIKNIKDLCIIKEEKWDI